MGRVVLIYGSKSDLPHAERARRLFRKLRVKFEQRIASAHKTPGKLLEMLDEYEKSGEQIVYLTIAGRSNALSGLVDAQVSRPVIACPSGVEDFPLDVYSSLRMPSGVASMVVLDPEAAALAAAKVLAMEDRKLMERIAAFQRVIKEKIHSDDRTLRRGLERKSR